MLLSDIIKLKPKVGAVMKNPFYSGEQNGKYIANINATWQSYFTSSYNGENIRPSAFPYISGYKMAADSLVENLIVADARMEMLVYPITFMYRQYLELVLKNFYFIHHPEDAVNCINQCNHSLTKLLNMCNDSLVQHLEANFPTIGNRDFLSEFHTFIKDFDFLDPCSFNFRYDYDRQRNNSIKNQYSIDLQILKDNIDEIDFVFFLTYNGA